MPIQKIVKRAFENSPTLSNRVIFFLTGIFLSAIFFLILLKFLGTFGVFLALGISIGMNIWLKKKHRQTQKERIYTNSFNNGLITFNVIIVSVTIIIFVLFYGAAQNLLN